MSRLTEFDINDTVTVRGEFRVSSTLTDPTTITLQVTDPSGNVATYTYGAGQITRDSLGVYSKSIAADEAGEWVAVWTGAGSCAASGTSRFVVRRAGA